MSSRNAIFFDLDGTLLELRHEYRDLLAGTFDAIEGEVRDGWIRQYNERFFELFEACEPDPATRAFAATGARSDPEALAGELHRREIASCQPPAGIHADLQRLTADHALGVLTNGVPEWQREKLHEHDLAGYFETVVTSYEAGAHKPDEAPYRVAERRLPAESYAMIGDSDADVTGARTVGWTAYRYSGAGFGDVPAVLDRE